MPSAWSFSPAQSTPPSRDIADIKPQLGRYNMDHAPIMADWRWWVSRPE